MNHMSEDGTEGVSEAPEASRPDLATLQFVLQETRVALLQQILAHDTGALSVEELCYRNPDLSEENVRYHLRELEERGVVDGLEIPRGERTRELPNTFFAVTEAGLRLLRRANLDEELGVWKAVYDRLERTDRIERIEGMAERPTADRHGADGVPDEPGTRSASANGPD